MMKIKSFLALVPALAMVMGVLGITELLFFNGNHGYSEPVVTNSQELERKGLGRNRFLSLSEDFVIEDAVVWSDGVSGKTFVPLFGKHAEKVSASPSLFIEFEQRLSVNERKFLREKSMEGPLNLKGLVYRGASFETNLIRERYPNVAEAPLLLKWNSMSKPGFFCMAACIWMGCLFFVALTLFNCCRAAHWPNSQAARIGMMWVGIVVAGFAGTFWMMESQAVSQYLMSVTFIIGLSLALVGAIMTALGANLVWREKYRQAELTSVGETLFIKKGRTKREIPFSDIVDVRIPRNESQKFEVRTADTKITAEFKKKSFEKNDTTKQLKKLSKALAKRAIEKILDGEEYTVGQWSILGNELRIGKEDEFNSYCLDQISAIYVIDGVPKMWVFEQDQPVETLKYGAVNSSVFIDVVRYFIDLNKREIEAAEQAIQSDQVSDASTGTKRTRTEGLGMVIYEESQFGLSLIGALLICFAIAPLAWLISGNFWVFVFSAILGMIVTLFKHRKSDCGTKVFRIHENGVSLEQSGETKSILYRDTESFRYKFYTFENQRASAQLAQAAVAMSSPLMAAFGDKDKWDFEFVSESSPEKPSEMIKFQSIKKTDQFEKMKQDASEEIGMQMAAKLAENGSVEWTPGCMIYKDALEVPARWAKTGKARRVSIDEITETSISKSTLVLKIGNKMLSKKLKIETTQPNFYPGYSLFTQLLEITREVRESQSQANDHQYVVHG